MVKEIMEEIKKAEDAADGKLDEARLKAKSMIEEAEKNVETKRQESLKKQTLKNEERMEAARKEGNAYLSDTDKKTEELKKNIMKMASEKESGAVDLVIKEIL